jgi:hypothetical protein
VLLIHIPYVPLRVCSSQFTEYVSPRSNLSIQGVPPSMNKPGRSRIRELTSCNYAHTNLTLTLIAKLRIHVICTIHCSFTSSLQFIISLILIEWLWKNIDFRRFLSVFLKLLDQF